MYWPVLDERLGRRVREQVERALKAKRGVWAIVRWFMWRCDIWTVYDKSVENISKYYLGC